MRSHTGSRRRDLLRAEAAAIRAHGIDVAVWLPGRSGADGMAEAVALTHAAILLLPAEPDRPGVVRRTLHYHATRIPAPIVAVDPSGRLAPIEPLGGRRPAEGSSLRAPGREARSRAGRRRIRSGSCLGSPVGRGGHRRLTVAAATPSTDAPSDLGLATGRRCGRPWLDDRRVPPDRAVGRDGQDGGRARASGLGLDRQREDGPSRPATTDPKALPSRASSTGQPSTTRPRLSIAMRLPSILSWTD